MKVIALPRFQRGIKKLHASEKATRDDAIRAILANPELGELKKCALAGVRVHKYLLNTQPILRAYRIAPAEDTLKLLAFGSHENFYRDLKQD